MDCYWGGGGGGGSTQGSGFAIMLEHAIDEQQGAPRRLGWPSYPNL